MLRIVIDSAGDLPEEWIKRYEIDIIPINVHMGDKVFLENVNLSIGQFYDWVKKTWLIPQWWRFGHKAVYINVRVPWLRTVRLQVPADQPIPVVRPPH